MFAKELFWKKGDKNHQSKSRYRNQHLRTVTRYFRKADQGSLRNWLCNSSLYWGRVLVRTILPYQHHLQFGTFFNWDHLSWSGRGCGSACTAELHSSTQEHVGQG